MTQKTDGNESTCRQALALVFIEDQVFEDIYNTQNAFVRGTLFEKLDKPLKTEEKSI